MAGFQMYFLLPLLSVIRLPLSQVARSTQTLVAGFLHPHRRTKHSLELESQLYTAASTQPLAVCVGLGQKEQVEIGIPMNCRFQIRLHSGESALLSPTRFLPVGEKNINSNKHV